jgi:hypothetical protein
VHHSTGAARSELRSRSASALAECSASSSDARARQAGAMRAHDLYLAIDAGKAGIGTRLFSPGACTKVGRADNAPSVLGPAPDEVQPLAIESEPNTWLAGRDRSHIQEGTSPRRVGRRRKRPPLCMRAHRRTVRLLVRSLPGSSSQGVVYPPHPAGAQARRRRAQRRLLFLAVRPWRRAGARGCVPRRSATARAAQQRERRFVLCAGYRAPTRDGEPAIEALADRAGERSGGFIPAERQASSGIHRH